MNRITQDAKKRQAVIRRVERKNKSFASRQYGVSLSSVKRWCKRYDGKRQSLKERSHRPNSHPARHTAEEETLIREGFKAKYCRYARDGVYAEIQKAGYTRSLSGMIYAGKRMGLLWGEKKRKPPRKHDRKFPEQSNPGDKVQIDVKDRGAESLPPVIASFGAFFPFRLEGLSTRLRFKSEKSLKICSGAKQFIRSGGSSEQIQTHNTACASLCQSYHVKPIN